MESSILDSSAEYSNLSFGYLNVILFYLLISKRFNFQPLSAKQNFSRWEIFCLLHWRSIKQQQTSLYVYRYDNAYCIEWVLGTSVATSCHQTYTIKRWQSLIISYALLPSPPKITNRSSFLSHLSELSVGVDIETVLGWGGSLPFNGCPLQSL